MLLNNHKVAWKHFKILVAGFNQSVLKLKEILFVQRYKPSLNKKTFSEKLSFFLESIVFIVFVASNFATLICVT